jgi:putative sigma-54 modulation protein
VQIVVNARHAEITEEMKAYAEEKTSKLLKYYDKIQEIEVVLDRDSANHRVEVIVNAEHRNTFVANGTGEDFFEATDLVVDKLGRHDAQAVQLASHERDRMGRQRRSPAASPAPGTAARRASCAARPGSPGSDT